MKVAEYLGSNVSALLAASPFSGWHATRSVDTDESNPKAPSEVWYEFKEHGVEVLCDQAELVQAIYLHGGIDSEALCGVPFSSSRNEITARYGTPAKSGEPSHHPKLGRSGAWDRFVVGSAVIHFRYCVEDDQIDRVTLMTLDVTP